MNKIFAVLLIAVCCILFSACNSERSETVTTATATQLTTQHYKYNGRTNNTGSRINNFTETRNPNTKY